MLTQYDYISILGPTATGKSDIAVRLADYYPIEIISVDSVSVYQQLDIGSAKPSVEERAQVPHHLIDVCTLDSIYTVGQFIEDANQLVKAIQQRGNLPVFCGGSMMYMAAFKKGYQVPTVDSAITKRLNEQLAVEGVEPLYAELEVVDPKMAERLMPQDKQRIIRALSVKEATGRSLMSYWSTVKHPYRSKDCLIMVNDRERHRNRLSLRVDQMLERGLQKECEDLLKIYGDIQHPALKSIGYKEMMDVLRKQSLTKDVRNKICIATAQFVKRQMTWLNSWKNQELISIDLYEHDAKTEKVLKVMVESIG